jgi:hypothetical protein
MCVSKVPDVAVEFIFGVMPLAVQGYDVKQMREANRKIVLVRACIFMNVLDYLTQCFDEPEHSANVIIGGIMLLDESDLVRLVVVSAREYIDI